MLSSILSNGAGLNFLEKLDVGAFADVWKATDRFGRCVAVKIVRKSMAGEVDAMQHASALARAAHPNVVTMYTMEQVEAPGGEGLCDAVIMEFLDGETLASRLGRAFTVREVGALAHGLIDGIDHIHACGLAHGDLHEGNIMITAGGVKIIDILYRDTMAIIGTSSRAARLSLDLRRTADHIRSMLERSDLPEQSSAFLSALEPPVETASQLRQALAQVQRTALCGSSRMIRPSCMSRRAESVAELLRLLGDGRLELLCVNLVGKLGSLVYAGVAPLRQHGSDILADLQKSAMPEGDLPQTLARVRAWTGEIARYFNTLAASFGKDEVFRATRVHARPIRAELDLRFRELAMLSVTVCEPSGHAACIPFKAPRLHRLRRDPNPE